MKIKTFFVAALFGASAIAETYYLDLSAPRKKGFAKWAMMELNEDHHNRQPNQPPSQWTNLTFLIPDYAVAIQITSANASGSVTCATNATDGVCTAWVPKWAVDELSGEFEPSVVWWGPPLMVSVGFLMQQPRQNQDQT